METELSKTIIRLRYLITIACLLSGFLAGENIDRYIVQVPAWRHISILSWAQFVHYADLGNGAFLYPAEAIVSALLLIVAAIVALRRKNEMLLVIFPVYLSALFALAGLVFTFFAAPYLLNIDKDGNNTSALQQTFDNFHFWGTFRATAQVLSFCFCVWAMATVYGFRSRNSGIAN
jgi:hypothetical protein